MKFPHPTPPDEELMLAYGAGDEEAFVILFKRYNVRIFNYLIRHLGNRARAEDLLQETFLRVHSHRKSYQPSAAFSTWIFTIATNLLRDSALAARRQSNVIEFDEIREQVAVGATVSKSIPIAAEGSAETKYGEKEVAQHIRRAIQSLPSDQREVILLAKYEGFKYEQIAEILSITASAAKVRAHRAMKALEKILKNRLGEFLA